MKHGFLLVDKPEGPTSHDIVGQVRARLHEPKIGHLGTLDPAASGLLVLAVGSKALKVVELFHELDKEYEADVHLGAVSTTYDREGVIEEQAPKPGWEVPVPHVVQRAIADSFLGKINQVPPEASAIKIGGERAYRKMRQGRAVDLPARSVRIDSCDILSYDYPLLRLRVACGSGTYIRSLAHDLGHKLHCGGYLSGLRRTKVGEWSVTDAVVPDKATWAQVLPLKDILADQLSVELTDDEADHVRHGRPFDREVQGNTIAWYEGLPIALLIPLMDGTQRCRARKVL